MRSGMSFVEELSKHKLLGIIRGADAQASVDTAVALAEEGIRLFEISLTSSDALSVLQEVAGSMGETVELGAGTVLSERQVDQAVQSGATYIVTPGLAPSVPYAISKGIPVVCGALTPTEVINAVNQGVSAVKIFPAGAVSPGYLKDLRAPFPDVPFIPVGGVTVDDVLQHLNHGAIAVGVASPLCGDAPNGGDLEALRKRARLFLSEVAQ